MNLRKAPVLRVMRREIGRVGRKPALAALVLFVPLVVSVLLAGIYERGVVQDLPMAVVDLDHSALSRTLARSADATRSLAVVVELPSSDAVREAMLRGDIEGALVFPRGLEAAVRQGKAAEVVVYKNTANLITGNLILKDAVAVVRTVSAGVLVRRLRARGLPPDAALKLANPIRVETQSLYNPGYNYATYLVPGLLPMLLQAVVMLAAAVAVNAEHREGTFAALLEAADGRAYAVVAGKALAYLLVFGALSVGMVGVLYPAFGIPVAAKPLPVVALSVYFLAACFFPAFLASCLFDNPMLSTEAAVFISTPAFLFSGYTFPLWAMPGLHRVFAQGLPFTHYLSAFVKQYQMGLSGGALLPEVLALSAFIWPAYLVSTLVLRRRIRRHRLHTQEAMVA